MQRLAHAASSPRSEDEENLSEEIEENFSDESVDHSSSSESGDIENYGHGGGNSTLVEVLRNVCSENKKLKALVRELKAKIEDLCDNRCEDNQNHAITTGSAKFGPAELFEVVNSTGRRRSKPASIYKEIHILTDVDILYIGLRYAGFEPTRQQNVNDETNIERFKSFYGVPPTTVAPFFKDLRDDNRCMVYKDCFMTMNWMFLYETYHVLSGRWKCCVEYIGSRLIQYCKMMAKLRHKKILLRFKPGNHTYKATLDGCIFDVNEMRLDPSTEWFNHKSHSCGLVSSFVHVHFYIYRPRLLKLIISLYLLSKYVEI